MVSNLIPRGSMLLLTCQHPKTKLELQSFVGLWNYLSCYVLHLTDVLSPLRALTVKSIEFKWEWLHEESFKKAKQAIANSCMLQYFNIEDPITIQVDASSIGVGAALMQQGRVVSYHSRALTPNTTEIFKHRM